MSPRAGRRRGDAKSVKIRPVAVLATATLITFVGALAPAASDAAWWPWSKRQERAAAEQQQQQQLQQQQLQQQQLQQALPPQGGDGVAVVQMDATERLNRAEARIRDLTGQVEELNFRLRQIQQQLGIETGDAATTGGVMVIPESNAAVAVPQDLGRLTIDAPSDQPIDLAAPPAGSAPAGSALRGSAQIVSLGVPAADYDQAYSAILSGDYELAEAAFRNFLDIYPNDERVSDARYWLGESLFARGEFSDAADEFLAGYKADPQSGKAPDTLLKLGLSLAGLGEREAACSTYGEVLRKYPDASKALRQRVTNEQAVASC